MRDHPDVFAEKLLLPEHRGFFDHKIELIPNAQAVALRPYRVPSPRVPELQRQLKDLLDTGHIIAS